MRAIGKGAENYKKPLAAGCNKIFDGATVEGKNARHVAVSLWYLLPPYGLDLQDGKVLG